MDEHPATENPPEADEEEPWPVGFLIIVLLAALYLGWRLVQAIDWVFDKVCGGCG